MGSEYRLFRGTIRRRLLVNALVDPDQAARHLPAGLRPHEVNGGTLIGCLLDIDSIRPASLPGNVGARLRGAAHRVSVEWETTWAPRPSVCTCRSGTRTLKPLLPSEVAGFPASIAGRRSLSPTMIVAFAGRSSRAIGRPTTASASSPRSRRARRRRQPRHDGGAPRHASPAVVAADATAARPRRCLAHAERSGLSL